MIYRTTCPHCASVFQLGEDQLDAAQGWVQCGVCGKAFNAFTSLLMADGSPLPPIEETSAPPVQPDAPATPLEAGESAHDAAAEEPLTDATPTPQDILPADTPRGIAQRDTAADLPSIILIDPDMETPDEPEALPQFQPGSVYPLEAETPEYPPAVSPPPLHAARIEYAMPLPGAARLSRAPRRLKRWVWAVASFVLFAGLAAQSAYFLRDTLVSHLPQTRPAFKQACDMLGCTLSLPKNLARLQIVGSDLQTEASGRLKLTLTLGNRANQAQAWPVLVLTLTDQRNRPLARRSFAPSEYLGDVERNAAGIPARSEQALSLPLTVRDLAPMGFDLQLTH